MATGIKMVLVFALLGGTLWFLRRHDRSALVSARRAERPVAVLAQAKVGKTASVALVRIGTEAYAVGVTEQNVSLLVAQPIELAAEAEADAEPATPTPKPTPTPTSARAATSGTTFPTVGEFLRSALGRRPKVEYLDVALPVQAGPREPRTPISPTPMSRTPMSQSPISPTPMSQSPAGTDGSGSSPSARMPEPFGGR